MADSRGQSRAMRLVSQTPSGGVGRCDGRRLRASPRSRDANSRRRSWNVRPVIPASAHVRSQMSRMSFTGSPTSFPNTNAAGGCWAPSGACFRSSRTDRSPTSATQGTNTAAVRDFSHWAAERSGFSPVSVARATARRARAWHTACLSSGCAVGGGNRCGTDDRFDPWRLGRSCRCGCVVWCLALEEANRAPARATSRGSPADGAFDI